jgi:hypothetical protein
LRLAFAFTLRWNNANADGSSAAVLITAILFCRNAFRESSSARLDEESVMTQTRADDAAAASRGNLRKVEQQRKQATGSAASHFASIFVARQWQKRRLNQRR